MATHWDDDIIETSSGGPSEQQPSSSLEALACVTCRARKLKCDRKAPTCSRCEKSNNNCVYPETRRKPAFKRRNVKELEQRLAQVEGALRNASFRAARRHESVASGSNASGQSPESSFAVPDRPGLSPDVQTGENTNRRQSNELMGLGRFEGLPPDKMIEDLHDLFFQRGQTPLPMRSMIHRGRYMQAYYSAPHKRPAMCLQYAIWTMAASRHEKYGRYQEVFYRRARQYLEADEMKDSGEHFITLAHAQAWALLAIYEGSCMRYSRIAMSSAKCVRLVHVLGLHRLDEPADQAQNAPALQAIPPAQSWQEIEERRRVFWCAFCIDGHTSISSGWPSLMDVDQITTHLPASEEAFETGRPEKSSTLQDVFKGAQYSTLAGFVVNYHIFKLLLSHIHRLRPDDRPQDVDSGPFWQRHRELDNMLSSTFMFLPERFRLPRNILDPVAVRTTLNLHSSTICLHNSAWSVADRYNLPESLKNISKTRSLAAAQEIVNIIKLVRSTGELGKRTLTTPSLYCAAAAFIHQGMESPDNTGLQSLEFIVECIEIISRQDLIARAYFNQLTLDIEQSGLSGYIQLPQVPRRPSDGHLPLLAHGTLFPHDRFPSPLRLPFSLRTGNTLEDLAAWNASRTFSASVEGSTDYRTGAAGSGSGQSGSSKRKRTDTGFQRPLSFALTGHWFGHCAPLHFDPMTLPGPVDPFASTSGRHAELPHRSAAAGGLSSGNVPAHHHSDTTGQAMEEDFLMAFATFDESASTSPIQTSPTTAFGDISDLFASPTDVHGYNSFVNSGASSQNPNLIPNNIGMGVGGDLFPGLDVWGQMQDMGDGNQEQQQQQQHQFFEHQAARDPWAGIHQHIVPDENDGQGGGGGNWGSCG